DDHGQVIREGAQIEVGGNERYVSYCRRHWDDVVNPDATN
ncbi:MAG: thymidine kinase, partial [Hoeflea sp.]|nr:thymidine kinase [Hoeflea sp.]